MKKYILWGLEILLFAGLLYYFKLGIYPPKTENYDVVILGDSIVGKERENTTVASVVSDVTGLRVFSGAFGGTCASTKAGELRYELHEDSVNLVGLTDAVMQNDFGVPLADTPNNRFKMGYFAEVLRDMEKIDWKRISYLVVEHGFNDYAGDRIADNPDNPFDISCYGGALRYSVTKFLEYNPNLKIILVSPTHGVVGDASPLAEQDLGRGTMSVFMDVQKKIVDEYGLDYIDMYYDAGFEENNIWNYTEDGLHLNEEGRKKYGTYLGNRLLEIRSGNT